MKRAAHKILRFIKDSMMFTYFLANLVVFKSFSNPIRKKYDGTIAVLANGPSLKEVLPHLTTSDEFRGVDFLMMNFMAFEKVFFAIKPKHYCLADPIFFKDTYRYRLEYSDDVKRLFTILQNDIDWKMNLYIPARFAEGFARHSGINNRNISVIGISTVEYMGFESFRNFFYKKGLCAPYVASVANLSIYVGINSGFQKLMLYGVDHTFFDICVNEKNQLCRIEKHFYDEEKVTLKPVLEGNGANEHISTYLGFITKIFKSHDYLSSYAKYMGTEIINCTACSLIDSYARK